MICKKDGFDANVGNLLKETLVKAAGPEMSAWMSCLWNNAGEHPDQQEFADYWMQKSCITPVCGLSPSCKESCQAEAEGLADSLQIPAPYNKQLCDQHTWLKYVEPHQIGELQKNQHMKTFLECMTTKGDDAEMEAVQAWVERTSFKYTWKISRALT